MAVMYRSDPYPVADDDDDDDEKVWEYVRRMIIIRGEMCVWK